MNCRAAKGKVAAYPRIHASEMSDWDQGLTFLAEMIKEAISDIRQNRFSSGAVLWTEQSFGLFMDIEDLLIYMAQIFFLQLKMKSAMHTYDQEALTYHFKDL